jgi:hypothetical protein
MAPLYFAKTTSTISRPNYCPSPTDAHSLSQKHHATLTLSQTKSSSISSARCVPARSPAAPQAQAPAATSSSRGGHGARFWRRHPRTRGGGGGPQGHGAAGACGGAGEREGGPRCLSSTRRGAASASSKSAASTSSKRPTHLSAHAVSMAQPAGGWRLARGAAVAGRGRRGEGADTAPAVFPE